MRNIKHLNSNDDLYDIPEEENKYSSSKNVPHC